MSDFWLVSLRFRFACVHVSSRVIYSLALGCSFTAGFVGCSCLRLGLGFCVLPSVVRVNIFFCLVSFVLCRYHQVISHILGACSMDMTRGDIPWEDGEVLDLGELVDAFAHSMHAKPACLVGKLVHEKPGNVFAIKEVMLKAFRLKGKLAIWDWGNGLLFFSFELADDRKWVIRNQPWHFDGHLFAVKALEGMEQPSSISLLKVSLWIRASDIPSNFQIPAVIKSIASRVGKLEAYDVPHDQNPEEFIRFRAEMDFLKPQMKGIYVQFGGDLLCLPLEDQK